MYKRQIATARNRARSLETAALDTCVDGDDKRFAEVQAAARALYESLPRAVSLAPLDAAPTSEPYPYTVGDSLHTVFSFNPFRLDPFDCST
jgi:hypothetical protein